MKFEVYLGFDADADGEVGSIFDARAKVTGLKYGTNLSQGKVSSEASFPSGKHRAYLRVPRCFLDDSPSSFGG